MNIKQISMFLISITLLYILWLLEKLYLALIPLEEQISNMNI